jgi:hypothetical protein
VKRSGLLALICAVAVFAAVWYFAGRNVERPGSGHTGAPATDSRATPATGGAPASATSEPGGREPPPADPRLAAFRLSPDNGLIEFIPGPDGKVIKEMDKDPSSPGFGKPLREYAYAGDKMVAVTSYQYGGGQVQVTRTQVSYREDGSVDQFRETVEYAKDR